MRRAVLGRLVLLLLVACALPALGQGQPLLPPLPAQSQAFLPGTWVEYLITHPGTAKAMVVRLAALERERGGQWFEMNFTDAERRTLSVKVLLQGTLQAPRRVLRALVQPQGQQPLELPERLAARQLPPFRRDPGKDRAAVRSGGGRVTVPAGKFAAERYRLTEQDRTVEMWTSTTIAGWPLVKLQGPDVVLELAAHGTGASSRIRGKPAQLDERWPGVGTPAPSPKAQPAKP